MVRIKYHCIYCREDVFLKKDVLEELAEDIGVTIPELKINCPECKNLVILSQKV